jgi:DNA helicase-2/ATP-dependent DNA helicase PcrA
MEKERRARTLDEVLLRFERMKIFRVPLIPESLSRSHGIHVMTAHQSKGLEFEWVILPTVLDGIWGNVRSRDILPLPDSVTSTHGGGDDKNEEERRLFFVALTRAKQGIEISFPESI